MSDKDAKCELATKPIKIEEGISEDDTKKADVNMFDKNIIPKIWDFIDAEKQFAALKQLNFADEQIDFPKMKKKLYGDFEQFTEDIKQFHRNCSTQKQSIKKASKELICYVNEQIALIKACKECYENAHKHGKRSVSIVCSKLHLLLWAKAQGYSSYWPAKVMIVNAQENTVHVRFFGDYSKSILPANKCLLYSKDAPDKKSDHQKSYQDAVEEADDYLEEMCLEFDHYNYAKPHVNFDPAKIDDYLWQMIASPADLKAVADPSFDWSEDSGSSYHDNDGNSNSSAMDSDDANLDTEISTGNDNASQNITRKRSTESNSIDGRAAKKICGEVDFSKVSDPIAQAFSIVIRADNEKEEKIKKLQMDLDNTKKDLTQKNAKLADEKRELEDEKVGLMAKISSLEEDLRSERKNAADEKKMITEKFTALINTKDEDKKVLDEVNKALMDKNSVLESELCDEQKRSDDRKKYFEEGMRQWNKM